MHEQRQTRPSLLAATTMLLTAGVIAIFPVARGLAQSALDRREVASEVRQLFAEHCLRCHDTDTAEGDMNLGQLSGQFSDRGEQARWLEIINVLNSHQMPPADEPQPPVALVAAAVDWITLQVTQAEERAAQGVVMRRMNRNQYGRTIRDLLDLDIDIASFPLDPTADGFDNNAAALSLSPMQIELYLDVAQQILDRALVSGDQPPVLRWRFEPETGDSDSNRVTYDGQRVIVNGGQNKELNGGRLLHHANWDRGVNARDFQLPFEGLYTLRVRAAGRVPDRASVVASAKGYLEHRFQEQLLNRPDQEKYLRQEMEETLRHFETDSDYDYGPPRLRLIQDYRGQPRVVAEFDVPAALAQPEVYEFQARFPAGKTGVLVEYAYSIPRELENFWFQSDDDFARPEAWVDWIEIEGPINTHWPPRAKSQLLPESQVRAQEEGEYVAKALRRWMGKSYRRPVTTAEVAAKLALYEQARQQSPSAPLEEVIRPALQAVMVSPHFLFLTQPPSAGAQQRLSQYELATRLSYFLWSSTPDDRLLRLANKEQLVTPEKLAAEVERMLADPRSEAFVEEFASQWLGLRELGTNPPAAELFPEYDRHLEVSLRGESLAFFREILQHDLSVMNFVQSSFVTINERVARFYEIPGVRGDHFRRVDLPPETPRGGLVTQAAMLSITSNGTRTSPVKRGTWILKTLLDDDPGLPVANAGDIAPKVPGIDRATVRQRLEIHRELPQCARCHNKIDPLGFALENFNAAGKWRDREGFGYQGRIGADDPQIDATASLPDGTTIRGVRELQQALMERDEAFVDALARKLLTYALGRELGLRDEPTVAEVASAAHKNGRTLRAMLVAIVQSAPFRHH